MRSEVLSLSQVVKGLPMRILAMSCAFFFGLLAVFACRTAPKAVRSERIAYDDRVVFHSSVHEPTRSMSVLNCGPGPVEAIIKVEGVPAHRFELPEGALEYVMLLELQSLEIRHPASGPANLEWTVHANLRDRIQVQVDGQPADSGETR